MRRPLLLPLLLHLLPSFSPTTLAKPYPRRNVLGELEIRELLYDRGCSNPCGWAGQLCCGSSQACYTDSAGEAQCSAASETTTVEGGTWQYYTSTYVETDLVTRVSTWSSYVSPEATGWSEATTTACTTAAAATASCNYALNESPCGSICCANGQYCQSQGQCAVAEGGSSGEYTGWATTAAATSETYSAALRPTSGGSTIVTSTVSPTTTVPFSTPVATAGANLTVSASSGGGGLSGGAIAGIVIGTIAGVFLLLLLCAALCLRAGWDGLMALLGLGNRRRVREETIIEERHSRYGSAGGGRVQQHNGWFGGGGGGGGGGRPSRPPPRPSGGGGGGNGLGGLGAVGAGLATLAIILGLRRRRERQEKSDYSSTYYSSEYSSESSASSDDRRTRRTSRR